jgi:XTP/dITP diphosphohydrolase
MRELIIASRNRHKIEEIKSILEGIPFAISSLESYPKIPEVQEIGSTYEENALLKAVQVAKATGRLALGDDTGLEVESLDGQPGLYSARFAGEGVTYRENNERLLRLLSNIPPSRRQAIFRCVMALATPSGKTHVVEGVVQGTIALKEQGDRGFGYDPLFIYPDLQKTFAEMTPEEKNKVSHRARALQQIRRTLMEL